MFTPFELRSVHELEDGKVAQAFNRHVKRASDDCRDRPLDSKPRVVILQVEITPDPDDQGNCDKVKMVVQTTSKVPAHHTRSISVGLKHNGTLVLNLDSPDNVDQGTLPYPQRDDD